MKVHNPTSINVSNNHKTYSMNPNLNKYAQATFAGRNDEFVRATEDAFEIAGQKLRERFQALLEEASKSDSAPNITDQIYSTSKRNASLAQINNEYVAFDNIINEALKKSQPEMAKRAGEWIDNMRKLAKQNGGFKKVYGYQEIKDFLTNKFVLGDMMHDWVTKGKGDVPNALLVYGPPNNGKTLFAKALAEESQSHLEEISLAKLLTEGIKKKIPYEHLAMDKILEHAENSLLNFKNNNGQRTIILVNEAEGLADPSSPIFKEFGKFIKTCSDKYKCTLFLTTNFSERFDKSILSQIPKDYKIGIAPADRKTCKEIIHSVLNPIGKMPTEGSDILVDAFFKTPDIFYSNASIIDIINNTLNEFTGKIPLIKDYLEVIKRNDVKPSISRAGLDEFIQTRNKLERLF